MPFRFILVSFLLIATNNTNADPFLETVEDERLAYLYKICESLDRLSDAKFLLIQKTDTIQKRYSLFELMQQIRQYDLKEISLQKNPIDLFPDFNSDENQAKAKMIKAPKVFFYSEKDGRSILKFECKSVIFFRKKIGPFEIPYKTHIIEDPLIQFL